MLLFALALLAGGISNGVYASDNSELWIDGCFLSDLDETEFCQRLERVRYSQIASTVSESS